MNLANLYMALALELFRRPIQSTGFKHIRIMATLVKYFGKLIFNRVQMVALVDDDCREFWPEGING